MFYYFEDNYMWSSAVLLTLMAGGQLGQIDRWLAPLRDKKPDTTAWTRAWNAAARQQFELAAKDEEHGYSFSASERYLRASTYYLTGERQTPPGSCKMQSYKDALTSFSRAMDLMTEPPERVVVPSPDGDLPGYLIKVTNKAKTSRPPIVVFYNGFDVVKETLYAIIREEFARRGIACLVVDTPGTGEPLRLRGVPSRPDYEVPTAAIVEYLETRTDIDAKRIGLLGISLGGYYAPRGAALEPRIKACAAWGAIWDYGAMWDRRWKTSSKLTSVPSWQLPWVMGTETVEEALKRAREFTLSGILGHLSQPLLIVHGAEDSGVSLEDAHRVIEEAGSEDKQLKLFGKEEGGSEHVGADDPDPTRQFIADWFLQHL
ncbi:alpha/beta-hydrolase [Thozetella sp. PMI_491]|nr:alpha/beta-hydrolase [Thozetella sp. PMI_491]